MDRKGKALAVAAVLCVVALVISVHQVRAEPKFALASWTFPADAYGQGIYSFYAYSNETGSWVQQYHRYYYDSSVMNWTAGWFIKLRVFTALNYTLVGISDTDAGKNLQRHNVTVTNSMSEIVFSKQNFTYQGVWTGILSGRYVYSYEVILNFLPVYGEYYTVTIHYDVFY